MFIYKIHCFYSHPNVCVQIALLVREGTRDKVNNSGMIPTIRKSFDGSRFEMLIDFHWKGPLYGYSVARLMALAICPKTGS